MRLRVARQILTTLAGLAWLALLIVLAVRGVRADGWLGYLDNGNVASILSVTVASSAVISAWHLWAEAQHERRHRDLKAHISAEHEASRLHAEGLSER